jgi:rieske iron-sulfur protein
MTIARRSLLDFGLTAAAAVTLPRVAPRAATPESSADPQPGDGFVPLSNPGGPALRSSMILLGVAPVPAWPMDRETGVVRDAAPFAFNEVLILRVQGPAAREPEGRLVAFTAVCPHAACTVSDWVAQTSRLRCPCHGSEYDPARSGKVTAGPAPVPLPELPVRVLNGVIIVAGPFSAPRGGHTSRTM